MRNNPALTLPSRTPIVAIDFMRQRKTDTLIIADENGRLLGIVSGYELQSSKENVQTISEIMQPMKTVLESSATAKDALKMIAKASYGIVPVVDGDKRIIGVVTRGSLLSFFANQWSEEGRD
jgi:osmoprotectant transport system ATP-binding protein